jgi:hypothetical protein
MALPYCLRQVEHLKKIRTIRIETIALADLPKNVVPFEAEELPAPKKVIRTKAQGKACQTASTLHKKAGV